MRLIVDLTTKAEKMNLRTERDGILLGQLLLKELERGKQDPFMVGKALKRLLAKLNGLVSFLLMLPRSWDLLSVLPSLLTLCGYLFGRRLRAHLQERTQPCTC